MPPETILAAMIALGTYHADRGDTAEARRALLLPVAEAIASVARTNEEAAALVVGAWHESHFARYVLEGRCAEGPRGAQCDPDRHGVARARGAWQVWRFCKATDTRGEAKCVLDQMRLGVRRCAGWSGGFAALHGASCEWSPSAARVQTMRRVLAVWGAR
jgi:hypothetical protein